MDRTATLKDHMQNHHDAIVKSLMNETPENILAAIATRDKLRMKKKEAKILDSIYPRTLKMRLLLVGWR